MKRQTLLSHIQLLFLVAIFIVFNSNLSQAQKKRFSGLYPLATPSENSGKELATEYNNTLTAILGGAMILNTDNIPTRQDDPEAYTKQKYSDIMNDMLGYADSITLMLVQEQPTKADFWRAEQASLKQMEKLIKGSKWTSLVQKLQNSGASAQNEPKKLFYIWYNYLEDKRKNAAWLKPQNIEVTTKYRALLNYIIKNYDRPYGAQAEQGAVIADAAQALSNSLENPEELTWNGQDQMAIKQDDELRRLASAIAYYEWKLHDPVSGQRSAAVNRTMVFHLQQSLYDVVETMVKNKDKWTHEPCHGANLQQLYNDTRACGWKVDGSSAKRVE